MVSSGLKIYHVWDWPLDLFPPMFIHVNTQIFIKVKTIPTNQSEAGSY